MTAPPPLGLFIAQAGRLTFVAPELAAWLGYTVDEMLHGMPAHGIASLACRSQLDDYLHRWASGAPGQGCDIQCQHRAGQVFDARAWGCRIEMDGAPAALVSLHDVSELDQAIRLAQHRAALLTQTEELALIGSREINLATGEVIHSAGMYRLFGELPSAEPVTADWLYARVPAPERQIVQSTCENLQPGETFEFQHRIVRHDGSVRIVLHRGLIELDARGTGLRSREILQDITSQREAEQTIDDLTHRDPVTRLANRGALLTRLDEGIRLAQAEQRALSLLVIEIDQYKLANETLGYAGGDHLLESIAHRLSTSAPHVDMLAHLGSGEFAALLCGPVDAGEAAAQALARSVIDAMAEPLLAGGAHIYATCGIGVALYPGDGDGAGLLLDRAQSAMRQAHLDGSKQIRFYTREANARATSRLSMEASLRHAVERKELYLCYQPQVDLRSGRIVGLEALVRWKNAAGDEVPPSEFIPLAEQTGLIVPIGDWVLRTACEDAVRWQAAGLRPVRVGVNLSIQQLQQPDIARRIQAILLQTRLSPHHLGVEITESMLIHNVEHVARILTELKAIGVEISLDDFGTGYSNLSYLSKLPIDVLKVDRSFVHDVTAASHDVSITRALISMAHGLQMKVLAEGVESESQLALLVANQCDLIQGYYFSRPVLPAGVESMLREDRRIPEDLLARKARKRTLLLVDDEENIIASLRRLLRKDEYHIVTANSGPEALQRLVENKVDVILSDQRMPGMTGVEFLRRAKELYPETVRMSLSGYTDLQSVTDAINEGAIYKFLVKPWDDERLRAHISEAFRQKEMADENRRLGEQVQSVNRALADVNDRLQRLLASQSQQIRRDETLLSSTREVMENIPAPVIGFDLEGMVTFINADAQDLFPAADSPLGRGAEEVLGPELLHVWRSSNGVHCPVEVDGQHFQAICRDIGNGAHARGKLMLLTPRLPGGPAPLMS